MRKSTLFAFAAAMVASAGIFSASAATTVNYTLNPAAGEATDLMSIQLLFPNDVVVFYENNRMPVATLTNMTSGEIYYCQDADRNTKAEATSGYNLVFIGEDNTEALPINQPGQYNLTIMGMQKVVEGEDAEDVTPIVAEYNINYPVHYLLTPAAGANVTDLGTITVDFDEVNNVEFYENNRMPVATLVNNTTGDEYICVEATRNTFAQTNGIAYSLVFTDTEGDVTPITAIGEYTLTIRALAQNIDDELVDLPVITANYQIAFPIDYVLTPDPAVPATNLKTITLEFPMNNDVIFTENNQMPVAVLVNETTGVSYVAQDATRNTKAETNGIAYDFTFVEEGEEEAADITAPGEYKLTIKSFGYESTETPNTIDEFLPVLNASYTIEYPVNYVFYPLGSVATNLKTVTVEFPDNKVDFYENTSMAAVLENLETGKVYECKDPMPNTRAEAGTVYELTFIDYDTDEEFPEAIDITEPGNYVITLRGMKYLVDLENDEWEDLTPITKAYTINYPYAYVLTPEDGAVVSDLSVISIEFPNEKVIFAENNRQPIVVLTNDQTGDEYVCYEPDRDASAATEGTFYTFHFMDEEGEVAVIDATGSYTLTINGMYIEGLDEDSEPTDDNIYLPTITAHYEIGFPIDFILNPTDGSKVENLKTISLEFPTTKNVSFYENNRMAVATLVNTTADITYVCESPDRDTYAQTDGILFNLVFNEEGAEESVDYIAEDGVYELTIKALLYNDEEAGKSFDLPNIYATYIIAGSGAAAAEMIDSEVYNVYTINGVQVVRNGSANDLNGLDAGLYIINGKKVLIRK